MVQPMSTAVGCASFYVVDNRGSEVSSNQVGSTSRPSEDDGESNTLTINNVESLKKGIIKKSKNKTGDKPCTILLVGETGVGKSSLLEFIANVLAGNDIDHYDFNILDRTNEQGGSHNQSQTKEVRLYKISSNSGSVVHILDTPGLADTRGIQQDALHRERVATQIKEHIDSITAVLVLTNGTVPRLTISTDYALSTLSTIFSKSLADNIAYIFTNVSNLLHQNFSGDTAPDILKNAPQFSFNNPIALQRKYLSFKDDPNMKNRGRAMREQVKASEQGALEMLVELFDWLGGLEPQPVTEIVPLTPMDRAKATKATNFVIASKEPVFVCRPKKITYSVWMTLWRSLRGWWEAMQGRGRQGASQLCEESDPSSGTSRHGHGTKQS